MRKIIRVGNTREIIWLGDFDRVIGQYPQYKVIELYSKRYFSYYSNAMHVIDVNCLKFLYV